MRPSRFITFATVRHRTIRSEGCLSNKTALAMVFKLVSGAQKTRRRLGGQNQLQCEIRRWNRGKLAQAPATKIRR
jgi:hypothetical protein